MALFPVSRFPFTISYQVTRNELGAQANIPNSSNYLVTSSTLSVRQEYSTLGRSRYSLWYDRTKSKSNVSDEYVNNGAGFSANVSRPSNSLNYGGGYSQSGKAGQDSRVRSSNLYVTHGYYPSGEFGINSGITHSRSVTKLDSNSANNSEDQNYIFSQASSNFYWRSLSHPYTLTGGVRFSESEQSTDSVSKSKQKQIETDLISAYRISRRTNANLAVNFNVRDTDGVQTLNSTQTGSLAFNSDSYFVAGFFYNWYLTGGVSNSSSRLQGDGSSETTAAPEATNINSEQKNNIQTVNSTFNHSASRFWQLGQNTRLTLGLGQSIAGGKSTADNKATASLGQSLSLNGNHSSYGGSTITSLTVSDSRSLTHEKNSFQIATAQAARQQSISRLSSLQGNIYFQVSRSKSSFNGKEISATQKSATANFGYQHSRVFGIYNLRFDSTLTSGNLLAEDRAQRKQLDWNNNLFYSIGLLVTSLNFHVYQTVSRERTYAVSFQATRSF